MSITDRTPCLLNIFCRGRSKSGLALSWSLGDYLTTAYVETAQLWECNTRGKAESL